jgi:hypothetical protein
MCVVILATSELLQRSFPSYASRIDDAHEGNTCANIRHLGDCHSHHRQTLRRSRVQIQFRAAEVNSYTATKCAMPNKAFIDTVLVDGLGTRFAVHVHLAPTVHVKHERDRSDASDYEQRFVLTLHTLEQQWTLVRHGTLAFRHVVLLCRSVSVTKVEYETCASARS